MMVDMTKNIHRYIRNELMYFLQNTTKNSAEYSIALELIKRMDHIPYMKIDEFAYITNVTPSTISKFCKKLGYRGYNELKDVIEKLPHNESHISFIRKNYTKNEYLDLFLEYDASLSKSFFDHLKNNTRVHSLSSVISQSHSVCVISPDYPSSSVLIFARTCFDNDIDCFKISRKSDHDLIINLTRNTEIILILSTTGEWITSSSSLITALIEHKSKIFVIGSNSMPQVISSFPELIPITLEDEYILLDSHYNSSRFYSLFFIYLSLTI